MRAAEEGHADCVCMLLETGADKEAQNDVRDALLHVGMIVFVSFCV